MTNDMKEGTYPLGELDDYTVAESDIDPRGWDVTSADNEELGTVKDLLVDVQHMKVRYLAVSLDEEWTGDTARCVLVPIGRARLTDDDERVLVALSAEQVRSLSPYELGGRIDRDRENAVLSEFGSPAGDGVGSFYEREEYDAEKFYGSRFMGDSEGKRHNLADERIAEAAAEDAEDADDAERVDRDRDVTEIRVR